MLNLLPSDRVFILTGAGASAESGIPTFRGVGGLWRNYQIEEVASPSAWSRDPALVWDFYSMRRRVAAEAKPNPAHLALADMERRLGHRLFLCTQNVDNLHEQAGSERVTHMHGELFKAAVTPANALLFQTAVFTSRPHRYLPASVEAESVRTFAGLARFRSRWTGSLRDYRTARFSWRSAPPG